MNCVIVRVDRSASASRALGSSKKRSQRTGDSSPNFRKMHASGWERAWSTTQRTCGRKTWRRTRRRRRSRLYAPNLNYQNKTMPKPPQSTNEQNTKQRTSIPACAPSAPGSSVTVGVRNAMFLLRLRRRPFPRSEPRALSVASSELTYTVPGSSVVDHASSVSTRATCGVGGGEEWR